MQKLPLRRWAIALPLLLLVTALCGGLFWLNWAARLDSPVPQEWRAVARAEGRQRWTAAALTHYRLELEHNEPRGRLCRQVVEVRDEQVVAVEQNTCEYAPEAMTVTGLFQLLERYTAEVVCGPNGCRCDGMMVADATYDAGLGFPEHLRIWLDSSQRTPLSPWDQIRQFWDPMVTSCTMIGIGEQEITVVALTPLP